jgi:hypothetical protein
MHLLTQGGGTRGGVALAISGQNGGGGILGHCCTLRMRENGGKLAQMICKNANSARKTHTEYTDLQLVSKAIQSLQRLVILKEKYKNLYGCAKVVSAVSIMHTVLVPVLGIRTRIRIRIGSRFNGVHGSGSGLRIRIRNRIQDSKNYPENIKKQLISFIF